MKEKEQDIESSLPKYERDYGEHGSIAGMPPNQDHGQPKNKRPPPDPANLEQNGDSPPFDHNTNADVKERGGTTPPGVDIRVGNQPQSSKIEDIAGLPHGYQPSLRIDNLSPWDDGMEEEEKLTQPTSLSSKDGKVPLPPLPDVEGGIMQAVEIPTITTHLSGGEQLSMPKSLSSQLNEKLSQSTSLSSKNGWVPLPPLPDVEGRIMQAVEMPTTHLSGKEQFSMPKSLSSQLNEKFSQPTSLSSKDGWVSLPPLPDVEGGIRQAVEMPTITTHLSGGEQLSMPKSLSNQLDEKLSPPVSLSSDDGWVPLPPLPDVEGSIMEAVEMPNTHLSGGEQYSMPKSLSSQLDEKLSPPVSLSSEDGWVPLPSPPDVEGGITQAVEMPNTHLSGGEQFSMPKSLSSQLDNILSRPFQASKSNKKFSKRA